MEVVTYRVCGPKEKYPVVGMGVSLPGLLE